VTSWDQDMARWTGWRKRSARCERPLKDGDGHRRLPLHHLHPDLGIDLDRHPRPAGHRAGAMVGDLPLRHRRGGDGAYTAGRAAACAGFRARRGRWRRCSAFQFCVNFNAVYLAEHHITSGWWRRVFALLLIPNSLLAWAWTGHKPSRSFILSAIPAIGGIALLFWNEVQSARAPLGQAALGIGLTLLGVMGASISNVLQTTERARAVPLPTMLTWGMIFGATFDGLFAILVSGPPVFDPRPGYWIGLVYLALFASALAFSLYMPIIRTIGPGRAAYSA
jgi:hypothetical protein